MHRSWVVVLVAWWLGSSQATPINIDPGAPQPAASTPVANPPLGELAIDEWVNTESGAVEVRALTERAQTDLLGQPYHLRARSWIESASDLHSADLRRLLLDSERIERERQTVQWLLQDESARANASATASAPAAVLERKARELLDRAEGMPAFPLLSGWARTAAIVLGLGMFVTTGVLLLARRPHRRRRHRKGDVAPRSSTDLTRRKRRRRHSSNRSNEPSTGTSTYPRRSSGSGRSHRHGGSRRKPQA